jgi:hypothetical protein
VSDEREILVVIEDGEIECGVLVHVSGDRPIRIVPDPSCTANVRDVANLADNMLRRGVPFDAIAALSPDSPRSGAVIEAIRDRLASETADTPAMPETKGVEQ